MSPTLAGSFFLAEPQGKSNSALVPQLCHITILQVLGMTSSHCPTVIKQHTHKYMESRKMVHRKLFAEQAAMETTWRRAWHVNPLQYSYLENPMDRGAWWATVYGVSKGRTRLKRLSTMRNRHRQQTCGHGRGWGGGGGRGWTVWRVTWKHTLPYVNT